MNFFLKLRFLKLYDIFRLQIGLFMFKTKNNLLPISCAKFVKRNVHNVVYRYCLSISNCFRVHSWHSSYKCSKAMYCCLWSFVLELLTWSFEKINYPKFLKTNNVTIFWIAKLLYHVSEIYLISILLAWFIFVSFYGFR